MCDCKDKLFNKIFNFKVEYIKDSNNKQRKLIYPSTYSFKDKWLIATKIVEDLKENSAQLIPIYIGVKSALILNDLNKDEQIKKILSKTHFFKLIKNSNGKKYYSFKYDNEISFPKGNYNIENIKTIKPSEIKLSKRDKEEDRILGVDYSKILEEVPF